MTGKQGVNDQILFERLTNNEPIPQDRLVVKIAMRENVSDRET